MVTLGECQSPRNGTADAEPMGPVNEPANRHPQAPGRRGGALLHRLPVVRSPRDHGYFDIPGTHSREQKARGGRQHTRTVTVAKAKLTASCPPQGPAPSGSRCCRAPRSSTGHPCRRTRRGSCDGRASRPEASRSTSPGNRSWFSCTRTSRQLGETPALSWTPKTAPAGLLLLGAS